MTKIRYLGILLILPLLTVTVASFTELPQVSALTKRDNTAPNDQHCTARISCAGQPKVCGDHTCSSGEYSRIQEQLHKIQGTKVTGKKIPTQSQTSTRESSTTQSGSVLKLTDANLPIVIPLVRGLYDGKDVFYITTEASDSDTASMVSKFTNFPITFAPALTKAPDSSLAQIYIFKNGVKGTGILGFQPNVVDSIPGDSKYSPLWRVNFVEWKDQSAATILGSDDDIQNAANQGKVTITQSKVVVNCPIISWSGNKEGTVPAGHMQIRADKTLTDMTPYGGGQVLNIDTQKMQVTFVAHRGFGPDGSTIYYIVTDTVMADPAKMMGVILANKTQATFTTSASSDLFQFGNGIKGTGPMGFQAGIGSTKPGDQFYSPIWRISVINWNDPSSATVLKSSSDITTHSDQTKIMPMNMVVNCPFFSADTVFAHAK
jgi:hypothetical protein